MGSVRKEIIGSAKRVVVKVGSAVVTGIHAYIDDPKAAPVSEGIFSRLAEEIHGAKERGVEVVIVSSGSIALGLKKIDMGGRPSTIPERQAVAALGQTSLMALYESAFGPFKTMTAQLLLTGDDLADRRRFLNARNTLTTLLGLGVVPIINENDTVAVDEIKFGDNDNLSALVTNLVEADLLIILTDIDGVFDRDPKGDASAKLIGVVEDVDSLDVDWGKAGRLGTGGIRSKVEAAKKAAHFGAATVIANGFTDGVIGKVLGGENVGTLIMPEEDRLTSKKHWIAYSTRPSGRLFMDDGAKKALTVGGKSLLPSGIKKVEGTFDAGEVVHCVDMEGMEFARGVANYSSAETLKIMGRKSAEIEGVLGYRVYDEVIHRDNLVVL